MTMGELVYRITATNAELKSKVSESQNVIRNFSATVQKGAQTLRTIGLAAGAAGTAIAYAMKRGLDSTVKYAEQVDKLTKSTGVAAETIQRLGYAALQEHASMAALANGLKYLSRNMNDMAQGIGEAKASFERLGIKVTDANGNLRRVDDVLYEIADKFKALPNETEKAALAMEIFGRSGIELVPFLNMGSEEIRRLGEEADKLGIVLSSANVKRFKAYSDQVTKVQQGLSGLRMTIATALLPIMERVIARSDVLIQGAVRWIKENASLVAKITLLGTALTGLAVSMGLVTAGATLLAKGISLVMGVISLVFSPLGLLIVTMGLLYTAWTQDWLGIRTTTEKVVDFLITKWRALQEHPAWQFLENVWKSMVQWLKDLWQVGREHDWAKTWEDIKAIVENAVDFVQGKLQGLADWFNKTDLGKAMKKMFADMQQIWADTELSFPEKVVSTLKLIPGVNVIVDFTQRLMDIWRDTDLTFGQKVLKSMDLIVETLVLDVLGWVFGTIAAQAVMKALAAAFSGAGLAAKATVGYMAAHALELTVIVATLYLMIRAIQALTGDKAAQEFVDEFNAKLQEKFLAAVQYVRIKLHLSPLTEEDFREMEARFKKINLWFAQLFDKYLPWLAKRMPWVQEALAEAEKAAIDAVSGAAPSAAQAKAAAEKAAVVAGMRYTAQFAEGAQAEAQAQAEKIVQTLSEAIDAAAKKTGVPPVFLASIGLTEGLEKSRKASFGVLPEGMSANFRREAHALAEELFGKDFAESTMEFQVAAAALAAKGWWEAFQRKFPEYAGQALDAVGPEVQAKFIEYMGKTWAPVGAENDPAGLNRHWIPNMKQWFVNTLQPLMRQHGYDSIAEFVAGIQAGAIQVQPVVERAAERLMMPLTFDVVANDLMAQRWGADMLNYFGKGVAETGKTLIRVIRDVFTRMFDAVWTLIQERFPELADFIRQLKEDMENALRSLDELFDQTTQKVETLQSSVQQVDERTKAWGESLADSLAHAIAYGEDLTDVFTNFLRQIAYEFLKLKVFQPMMQMLFGAWGVPALAFGGIGFGGPGFFALPFHTGGLVEPIRAHVGYLAPDEVPAILQTRERVLSRQQNKEFEQLLSEPRQIQVQMHIHAVDAESFASLAQRHPDAITSVVIQEIQRNGAIRRVLTGR